MVNIIKQELDIDESLVNKINFICDFCNTTPTFINGSVKQISKTNLTYIEPHRIIINDTTFLAFNFSNEIYIENLNKKIEDLDWEIETRDEEIEDLEKQVSFFKKQVNFWKDKFNKLLEFLQDKFFSYNKNYENVINDLYQEDILNSDDIEFIENGYSNSNEKDDFEI